jgi:hypothetical protein
LGVILLVVLAMFFAYLIAPLVDVVHRFIAQRGKQVIVTHAGGRRTREVVVALSDTAPRYAVLVHSRSSR